MQGEETPGEAPAAHDAEQAETHEPLDIGEVIATTAALLDDMERSGSDFNRLTGEDLSDAEFTEACTRAEEREQGNDRVFGSEHDACATLRSIEDAEIRAQLHRKARDYWRRAATSDKVANALADSYETSREPGADPRVLNPERFRKQLKELLGVVVSLSEQRAGLVALIFESRDRYEELINARYHDETETLLAEFDVLGMERHGLSKVHFKKRAQIMEEMRAKLAELEEVNARFSCYEFVSCQTRELPAE